MKMSRFFAPALLSIATVAMTTTATAQIKKAAPSPRGKVTQELGLSTVTVDYGRPGVKGRKVFGDMIPFTGIWRTGANGCTTINFSENVQIGGNDVPKGTYSIFTFPGEKTWEFVLNKNTELWGAGGYDPAEDLMRMEVPVQSVSDMYETFTMDFANFGSNGGDLLLTWEKTRIAVPIFVDSDPMVFKEIEEKVINAKGEVNARTYFDAAMFYVEKNKDLKMASGWLDKAVAMQPEAFWMIYQQAELAHKMGDNEKASTSVRKALAAAKASERGDFGYVIKCETLMKKLAGKPVEATSK